MKKRYLIPGILTLLFVAFCFWFYQRVVYEAPEHPDMVLDFSSVEKLSDNHFRLGNNWLRRNKDGNWESYIEGDPYERGRVIGLLQKKLVIGQEVVFVNEIERQVPTWLLRNFIMLGIAWFNRDLPEHIPMEFQQEIYGISENFSKEFDYIGPKYNRIMNYHAAHDIGHAVQNMRLVGCTAVGAWNFEDSTNQMIVGRNFDFYFGDDFAKEKIVLLVNPTIGYKYISVTWGGFIGVVSGMNEKGLGITLNSDKSEVPTSSATPVSIVAREILQYAQNIEEAIDIAKQYQTFVSESFTISSAHDKTVVVIEKTPTQLGVYRPKGNSIVVTNHFQSPELKNLAINLEHIKNSESLDRFKRTKELLDFKENPDPESIVGILRDQRGISNENIGYTNPKAINQLLAHHAVVFSNIEKKVWVSNYPFQENIFNAYDLDDFDIWSADKVVFPVSIDSLEISPDPFFLSEEYVAFENFKMIKYEIIEAIESESHMSEDRLIEFKLSNPEFYDTYRLLGDYYLSRNKKESAKINYDIALTKNIAYQEDADYIEYKLSKTLK